MPGLDSEQPRLATRAMGVLYLAGATILLLTIVLPGGKHADRPALLGIFAAACLTALLLLVFSGRVRQWQRHAGVVLGAALIALGVYFSGQSESQLALHFVWVAEYCQYF